LANEKDRPIPKERTLRLFTPKFEPSALKGHKGKKLQKGKKKKKTERGKFPRRTTVGGMIWEKGRLEKPRNQLANEQGFEEIKNRKKKWGDARDDAG